MSEPNARTEEYVFRSIGHHVTIFPNVVVTNPENVSIGSYVLISDFVFLMGGEGLVIGDHIHIAQFVSIAGGGRCMLEDFVGISAGSRIITGSEEATTGTGLTGPTIPAEFRAVYHSLVVLKKHSLLFTNVVVHPGVTIGEGAVIGSNSLVTKDVEPWTINYGSPCRPVRARPKEKILEYERLLRERERRDNSS